MLLKILRGHWKAYLIEKPSLELCRHLVMLRDYNISGRINLMEIPVLLHMLHFWKVSTDPSSWVSLTQKLFILLSLTDGTKISSCLNHIHLPRQNLIVP